MFTEEEKKNIEILMSAGAKVLADGKPIEQDISIKTEAVRLLKKIVVDEKVEEE